MRKNLLNSFRALLLSLAVLVSLPMLAEEINGINYDLNAETGQATVIALDGEEKYSGDVVIPASLELDGGATYSVTSIGDNAFYQCTDLTSVTIPNSVTSIGDFAFFWCSGLTSVTIPNSVTSIARHAFTLCSNLTSVTIGGGVTSIGDYAFSECEKLETITVDEGNTKYDSRDNCNAIIETETNTLVFGFKHTEIPNTVTGIGDCAFYYCSGLTSITIPANVVSIGKFVFGGCSNLESITVDEGNTKYDSRDNCNAIIETETNTLLYGCKSTIIPDGVTSIEDEAFFGCSGLTSVAIPNRVTSIGVNAFSGCSGLTSVAIPNRVTSIGSGAFFGCSGLTDLYCYAENVPETGEYAFENSPIGNATLHVPANAVNSYKEADVWSAFGKIAGIVDVSPVGYGTLYLDYNAEIPEDVEAYVASEVDGDRLKMQKVEGVLPAQTGVIIKADEGKYDFAWSDEEPAYIEGNLLEGSCENTYVTAQENTTYYVLSAPDGVVGMYKAKLTDNQFLNNANKAYLPISSNEGESTEGQSRRLVFAFSDATGIDELKAESGQVQTNVYDLSGRRVQNAKKGVFIVNGKVVVK